ncbi:MAG: hypothetical protein II549_07030 [Bacteroidaceae bacterium]|nr:hypothetical protein [Bacteroidaceae bacterium]
MEWPNFSPFLLILSLSSTPSTTFPEQPQLWRFHNHKIDIVDIGSSTSTTSANRHRRCRFGGCGREEKEAEG